MCSSTASGTPSYARGCRTSGGRPAAVALVIGECLFAGGTVQCNAAESLSVSMYGCARDKVCGCLCKTRGMADRIAIMVDRGFILSGTVFQLCCRPPGDRGSPALCIVAGVRESNNAEFCLDLWM